MENWNRFQESDIELNDVWHSASAPEFVADYESKLDSKPALANDVHEFLQSSLNLPADRYRHVCYFVDLSVPFPDGQCR
jgi:hypothetical protein